MALLLAVQASTIAILLLGVLGILVLAVIVIAPWRTIRDEPPLPEEAETRLLLGEDFEEVEEKLEDEPPDDAGASISELDPGERHQ